MTISKAISILYDMLDSYRPSSETYQAINLAISALQTIQDGNYKLELPASNTVTKDEILAMLKAITNIIEKGVT